MVNNCATIANDNQAVILQALLALGYSDRGRGAGAEGAAAGSGGELGD